MKPDFHCHSHYSDGKHSLSFLLQRALDTGVTHLSVTDHDCVDCYLESSEPDLNLTLIPGVEISCNWQNKEIHVVGLGIDPTSENLIRSLDRQQSKRKARIHAMHRELSKLGIEGLIDFMEELSAKTWTRSHVAEFLVNNGHCKNWEKAFKNFLNRRGKIYVPIDWLEMTEAVSLIREANGIAVLAHPGRYSLSKRKLQQLVADFQEVGGEAIEGSYGNIDPVTRKQLCELAIDQELHISMGSDFHDAARHWTDLGKVPPLDSQAIKNAIWNHPRWHF